ncbi:hypothetical protein CMV_014334 [Castanea mollissima]|uniref:DUF4283 domain-containing protein n=1 Tax=Castanea mollissima TaxID=60419 RepID=A0A8J4VUJ3_9ROSI|nr:hypothetical protein CMV_014334 [Castanea mollissima]
MPSRLLEHHRWVMADRRWCECRRRPSLGFDERERETEMKGIREKNVFEFGNKFGILCGLYSCVIRPSLPLFIGFIGLSLSSTFLTELSNVACHLETLSCEDLRLEFLPSQELAPNLTILAKLISLKPIGLNYIKDITSKAWKPVYPMEVKRIDKDIFMFSFQHKVDEHKVFQQRPWSCQGGHLVQVHGLPTLWRTEDNLKKINAQIGKILDVDLIRDSGGAWKRFLCIEVEIPIDKPLPLGFFQPRPNNTDSWIGLKYEKLANIYYKCGIIGHKEETCEGNPFLLCNPNGICSKVARHWLRLGNNATPFDDTLSNNTPPPLRPSKTATLASFNLPPPSSLALMDNTPVPPPQPAKGPAIVHGYAPHSNGNTWQSFGCPSALRKASHSTSKNNSNLAELDTRQESSLSPRLNYSRTRDNLPSPNHLKRKISNEELECFVKRLRKISNEELECFVKRLRKTDSRPELLFFDPNIVTLIPQSSLKQFILKEGQKFEDEAYNKKGPPYFSKRKKAWENLIALLESHQDENVELCCIPTLEEIKSTLFSMSDLKAPGPDGFPMIFYKHL